MPLQTAPAAPSAAQPIGCLLDLSSIDLAARTATRRQIESVIPHRGAMLLLDAIVWTSPDYREGVAVKHVREREFWSHPGRGGGTMPGMLMVEAAAQLACFLFNSRSAERPKAAFLRMEDVAIRRQPHAGDDLFLLCREVRYSRRRFIIDVQGVFDGHLAFGGRLSGMAI